MKLKSITVIMLTLLTINIAAILAAKALPPPVIAQTNSTATIYFDPPTINGTVVGQEFTVNITIRDAQDVVAWQAGLIFNSTLLNCTGVFEGEFLKDVGITYWQEGTINNTKGEIIPHGCILLEDVKANGSGRLAYATFKVKASGVSNLHLRDVLLIDVLEVRDNGNQLIFRAT